MTSEFVAEVHFLTKEEGGRVDLPMVGYRPSIRFGKSAQVMCVISEFISSSLAARVGGTAKVKIKMLRSDFDKHAQISNFSLHEGGRKVANGVRLTNEQE